MKLLCPASIFLFLMFACRKPAKHESVNQNTTIRLNECLQLNSTTETARLCFDSLLNDSRCPKNAVCIWAGVASAKFTFSVDGEFRSFVLSTINARPSYITDTVLSGYKIQMINVHPYPGDTPAEVSVEVKISR